MSSMDVVAFWNDEAERFDEQPDHGLGDAAVRTAWSNLLLPLMPSPSCRVADVGCGTGSVSLLLAGVGHQVSGLDIAPKMVAAARAKFARAGLPGSFEVADAASPPWPRDSFDVVITRHVLWAMPHPATALQAWLDLLAPDGLLLLVEGSWWTGAGMRASQVRQLVLQFRAEAEVTLLDDAGLWGAAVSDERFLVVSRR